MALCHAGHVVGYSTTSPTSIIIICLGFLLDCGAGMDQRGSLGVTGFASDACHIRLNPLLESTTTRAPERQPSGLLGWVRDSQTNSKLKLWVYTSMLQDSNKKDSFVDNVFEQQWEQDEALVWQYLHFVILGFQLRSHTDELQTIPISRLRANPRSIVGKNSGSPHLYLGYEPTVYQNNR